MCAPFSATGKPGEVGGEGSSVGVGRRSGSCFKDRKKRMKVPAPLGSRRPASLHVAGYAGEAGGTSRSDPGLGFGRAFAQVFEGQRLGRELGSGSGPKSHF